MISETCRNCKHVLWLIGSGMGVRCNANLENTIPVPISIVEEIDCMFEEKLNDYDKNK